MVTRERRVWSGPEVVTGRARGGAQVCKQGKTLSADQAALLRHFDIKMARFKMFLAAEWVKDGERLPSLWRQPSAGRGVNRKPNYPG